MRENRTAAHKAWRRLARREARLLQARRAEECGPIARFLEEKIPPRLEQTLTAAFSKAFALVFQRGSGLITRTLSPEKQRAQFAARSARLAQGQSGRALRSVSRAAARSKHAHVLAAGVEGIGLGLLGVGLADIPLFSAVLLRSLYQIALRFGFSHEGREEEDFTLLLIEAALLRGAAFEEANRQLNAWIDTGRPPEASREERLQGAAGALSDYLLYAKFVQGIPLLGAAGGALDALCLARVNDYARLKYQRRFLRGQGVV